MPYRKVKYFSFSGDKKENKRFELFKFFYKFFLKIEYEYLSDLRSIM